MRQRKIITHKTIFTLFGNLPTSIEFAGISLLSGKNSKVFSQKKIKTLLSVWYMCLKTENCCLKTFVEICVDKKVYGNA